MIGRSTDLILDCSPKLRLTRRSNETAILLRRRTVDGFRNNSSHPSIARGRVRVDMKLRRMTIELAVKAKDVRSSHVLLGDRYRTMATGVNRALGFKALTIHVTSALRSL
jgi:hypothetical protein